MKTILILILFILSINSFARIEMSKGKFDFGKTQMDPNSICGKLYNLPVEKLFDLNTKALKIAFNEGCIKEIFSKMTKDMPGQAQVELNVLFLSYKNDEVEKQKVVEFMVNMSAVHNEKLFEDLATTINLKYEVKVGFEYKIKEFYKLRLVIVKTLNELRKKNPKVFNYDELQMLDDIKNAKIEFNEIESMEEIKGMDEVYSIIRDTNDEIEKF